MDDNPVVQKLKGQLKQAEGKIQEMTGHKLEGKVKQMEGQTQVKIAEMRANFSHKKEDIQQDLGRRDIVEDRYSADRY